MAADHGLLTLTQLQQEQQQQQHQQQQQQQQQEQNPNPNPNPNPRATVNSWMWNKRRNQDEDDSWEVRAFAEDTGNIMGTTWPPRSYTCTFCRREFRSAQALGGHMNVHRRDRARLRQSSPVSTNNDPSSSSTSTSTLIFPSQEFVANGGLCLLYPLTSPTSGFNSNSMNGCMESPSTLLSNSPFQMNNFMSSVNFTEATTSINASSICHTSKLEPIVDNDNNETDDDKKEFAADEELDLELRLGSRPTQP